MCMSVYHEHTGHLWRSEEGTGPLGLELETLVSHHLQRTEPALSARVASALSL